MDLRQFERPGADYRVHPFWFWNGAMEEDEIRRQIAEMHRQGVGGFFICARQGLTVPYLSRQWFDKVRLAVEEAAERGMGAWLYDEYPYPSGMAGGEVVLEHPDARQTTLEHRLVRARGGEKLEVELPWGRIVYAKAAPVGPDGVVLWDRAIDVRDRIGNAQADPVFQKTGLTAYTQKRFFTYRTVYRLTWEVPEGEWTVVLFQELELEDFKYYGTYVDPCNREAMAAFIRLTHEKYAAAVGDFFGGAVKGMFTDEIGLLGRMPWSKRLAGEFRRRCGYALEERLPAFVDRFAPDAAKVRYDYYQTLHRLLREAYHKQASDWCVSRGLIYAAEVPVVRMATQTHSGMPGGDSAHEKLGRSLEWILRRYFANLRENPKMIGSLARQLGRERALIECFHSVGWSMTLQDARWMLDRLAAMGINFYNFHAFYYTMDALAKHDAPPSQFLQNPYWEHFLLLADYAGRLGYAMSRGEADIRFAYLDPTTTLWTHMGNPFQAFRYGGVDSEEEERLGKLREDWTEIGVRLLRARFDYDHLDPELLGEAEAVDGSLRLGRAEYKAIVLPPLVNLEGGAWEKLKAFKESGGVLIALGLLPYERIDGDGPSEEEAMRLFGASHSPRAVYWGESQGKTEDLPPSADGGAVFLPFEAGKAARQWDNLRRLLRDKAPSAAEFEPANAPDTGAILMQSRRYSEREAAVFLANQEGQRLEGTLRLRPEFLPTALASAVEAEAVELDLETGEGRRLAAWSLAAGRWELPLTMEPYESRLILIRRTAPESGANSGERPAEKLRLDASGEWNVQALGGNSLRLGDFGLQIRKGEALSAIGRVSAKTFVDQLADLAEREAVPAVFRQTFGTPMRMEPAYPIACAYTARFEIAELPSVCELAMDEGAVCGESRILLNGREIAPGALERRETHDRRQVACDVTALLQKGANELRVEATVRHDWEGVVDPLYLQGDFGAFFDETGGPVLARRPSAVSGIASGPVPGFPYYAGVLSYSRPFVLVELPQTDCFELEFDRWDPHFHDCAEVRVNGISLGVRPWTPYRWSGETQWLREGANEVEVRVTGTLVSFLDGDYFDYAAHKLRPVADRPAPQ
ncbi:glycosyl hydrolase [Cohnella cellulosilytica]|uniref:Glycosyl hydrolase n=1 Tax=Cohnella cellulosilytica TaxID=986710 RepID=A0ABW2F608_9BACL